MEIEILVVTHGRIAEELINTLKIIMGPAPALDFFPVRKDLPAEQIKKDYKRLTGTILQKKALLILTDLLGGTPTNISMPLLEKDNVEIITGVNLPMLIKAVHKRKSVKNVKKLAEILETAGKKSVLNCRDYIDRY
ncbi:MAG: PTS sugar transporter subunit IIA [Elusimicrobia bacterium]|jgi:PTS system mannose-specific IIA component|nr:PTS sugar transporter subunit IIA [Elusimicrobiota bacterium]